MASHYEAKIDLNDRAHADAPADSPNKAKLIGVIVLIVIVVIVAAALGLSN